MTFTVPLPESQPQTGRWRSFWPSLGADRSGNALGVGLFTHVLPDEPVHAIRAVAAANGDLTGSKSASQPSQMEVTVPAYVANSYEQDCSPSTPPSRRIANHPLMATVTYLYKRIHRWCEFPLFYAIVNVSALVTSGDLVLHAMRIMNRLPCPAPLATMIVSLRQLGLHRWTMFAVATAVPPVSLFVMGSINPNALKLTSAGALFATLALTLSSASPGGRSFNRPM
ncbi:DUF2142 domain-containing protein [Cryobacterium ruanii]